MVDFNYITEPISYNNAISSLGSATELALDTETMALNKTGSALDPFTGRISLLILQAPESDPYIFDLLWLEHFQVDYQPLKELLLNRTVLGANIKFDCKHLVKTLDLTLTKVQDVMIAAKLLSNATGSRAGRVRGHSLASLCRDFLNVHLEGKKELRESTWGIGLESRQLENDWWHTKLCYAANDVRYLFPLRDTIHSVLTTQLPHSPITQTENYLDQGNPWGFGMTETLKREYDFIPVLVAIELAGLPVDKSLMGKFQTAVSEQLLALGVKLSRVLKLDQPMQDLEGNWVPSPKAMRTLRSSQGLLALIKQALNLQLLDNIQANQLKRLESVLSQIASSLEQGDVDPKKGMVDFFVDEQESELYSALLEEELEQVCQNNELIKDLLTFKRLTKQEGMDLRTFINPATQRIHSNYSQIGCATGRMSSVSPNCIAQGHLVETPTGRRPIESIQPGDEVFALDLDNDYQRVIAKVMNVFNQGLKQVTQFNFTVPKMNNISVSLICTPEHRILTHDGWKECQQLTSEDTVLFFLEGVEAAIFQGSKVLNKQPVWDLEVENHHNFSINYLCVHNCQQISTKTKVPLQAKGTKLEEFLEDKEILINPRHSICSDSGSCLASIDFSNQEMFLAAAASHDPLMVQAFTAPENLTTPEGKEYVNPYSNLH
jgi:hypothetical protein